MPVLAIRGIRKGLHAGWDISKHFEILAYDDKTGAIDDIVIIGAGLSWTQQQVAIIRPVNKAAIAKGSQAHRAMVA